MLQPAALGTRTSQTEVWQRRQTKLKRHATLGWGQVAGIDLGMHASRAVEWMGNQTK